MSDDRVLEKRRKKINRKIKSYGCPYGLPSIGSYKKGNIELLDYVNHYQNSEPFFWVFTFSCRKPYTGELGFYTLDFSSQLVYLAYMHEKFLLRNMFMPGLGYRHDWVPSVITNFPDLETGKYLDLKYQEKPEILIQRDLASVAEITLGDIAEIKLIDVSAKDRGQSTVEFKTYFVRLEGVDFQKIKKRGRDCTYGLHSYEQVKQYKRNQKKPWDLKSKNAFSALRDAIELDEISLDG